MSEGTPPVWATRDSVLEHVELFRRGAQITRRLAPAGALRVRVGALPLELEDGSARIELAAGRALVRGLRVVLDVQSDETDPVHPETEELRALRRRLRAIALELDALRARFERATGLAIPERPARDHGRPPPPAPDRGRLELLELRFALQREAREQTQRLERERLQLERRLETTLERENKRSTDAALRHRVQKAVEIELERADADAVLALVYRVRSAVWAPSYRLTFDTRARRARLAMGAVVAQCTGENWRGASLSVSTARMDGWYDLPELASLRIGRAQPLPRTGYRPLPEGGAALFADHDRAFRLPASPVETSPRHGEPDPLAIPRSMSNDGLPPGGAATTKRTAPRSDARAAPPPMIAKAMPATQAMPAAPALPQAPAPRALARAPMLGHSDEGSFGAPMDQELVAESSVLPEHRPREEPRRQGAPAMRVTRALLDYGSLRLGAPSAAKRGVLRAADPQGDSVVVEALAAARAVEQVLGALSPPAAHTYPESLFGFDHRYDAEGRVDVPSDCAFHSVAITEAEGPATLLHVCVPREDAAVFRTLELDSPLAGAILEGPVDVYLDGALCISSSVAPTPTAGKLAIGMGIDESVKVARNVRFREESAGLLGGSASLVHQIEIDVQNAGASAIRLEVRERLPVIAKGQDDIEIRLGKTSPPWQDLAQDDPPLEGGKRWTLEVAAGQKATLSAEYAIRISARNELVGGNRRG